MYTKDTSKDRVMKAEGAFGMQVRILPHPPGAVAQLAERLIREVRRSEVRCLPAPKNSMPGVAQVVDFDGDMDTLCRECTLDSTQSVSETESSGERQQ